jgi:hypothetical protein
MDRSPRFSRCRRPRIRTCVFLAILLRDEAIRPSAMVPVVLHARKNSSSRGNPGHGFGDGSNPFLREAEASCRPGPPRLGRRDGPGVRPVLRRKVVRIGQAWQVQLALGGIPVRSSADFSRLRSGSVAFALGCAPGLRGRYGQGIDQLTPLHDSSEPNRRRLRGRGSQPRPGGESGTPGSRRNPRSGDVYRAI